MLKFLIASLLILTGLLVFIFMSGTKLEQKIIEIGKVKIAVEVATSLPQKFQGLSGRELLCANCGMLFVYDQPALQSFTMRGMKFPLDFIFIREGFVVEIRENIPHPRAGEEPQLVHSRIPADQVLEVNAGFVRANKIFVTGKVNGLESAVD